MSPTPDEPAVPGRTLHGRGHVLPHERDRYAVAAPRVGDGPTGLHP